MKVGKLTNDKLKSIIIDSIQHQREDVVLRSNIGEDCAGVRFGDEVCLMTTDPITGSASEVGKLAVHISCNDIASNGAAPVAILLTILAPEGTTEEELKEVMHQAGREAAALDVEIVGGHTEITNAVNRMVVSSTAIGRQKMDRLFSNAGMAAGDLIVMTKSAGIEGTGIIAYEKEEQMKQHLTSEELHDAKAMLNKISVVPEGVIAGQIGVTSMHDVTEGGLLGAVWEICEGCELGAIVEYEKILIHPVTHKICDFYHIDPLRLISSGTMLMTVKPYKKDELLLALSEKGIEASVIGEITQKDVYLEKRGRLRYVTPPDADDLYKVVF